MVGMALAIFTYRPIFQTFLDDTKYEVPGNISSEKFRHTYIIIIGGAIRYSFSTSNYVFQMVKISNNTNGYSFL